VPDKFDHPSRHIYKTRPIIAKTKQRKKTLPIYLYHSHSHSRSHIHIKEEAPML
jgi:hypothetical protein